MTTLYQVELSFPPLVVGVLLLSFCRLFIIASFGFAFFLSFPLLLLSFPLFLIFFLFIYLPGARYHRVTTSCE